MPINKGSELSLENQNEAAYGLKTIIMKQYGIPFLLKKALSFPEFGEVLDKRDYSLFLETEKNRDDYSSFENYDQSQEIIKKLFAEIFKERKIIEKIYPYEASTYYDLKEIENITFIFVPGVYNSIFNNEIFSIGVDALKNNFGLRVLTAP